jgi:hypothetical protein
MGKGSFQMDDYNTVTERIADFKAKHPSGSFQPADLSVPFTIVTIGDQAYVVYAAAAYRSPDDPRPGVGLAWEPVPGKTSFTKDSELQNAETSAWGRAIVAVLAADAKKFATREDVQNRQIEGAQPEVIHALVDQIKDTEVAGPLKEWMTEHNLSFTRPLSLAEFNTIEAWVANFSADQPSADGGGRAETPPIPSSAPAANSSGGDRAAGDPDALPGRGPVPSRESSTDDDQGKATANNRAESQRETSAVVGSPAEESLGEADSSAANLKADLRERIERLSESERLKLKALWTGARLVALDKAEMTEGYYEKAVALIGQAAA